jgi:hypothetical protein
MDQIKEVYVPGNCNIGPAEIKRRYRIGYLGLFLMTVFIVVAEVFHIPHMMKLFLFAPTFYALSGFFQAWQKFCFVYGWKGVFSIIGNRKYSKVTDENRLQDRSMAIRLVTRITLGSSLITLLYYFLF